MRHCVWCAAEVASAILLPHTDELLAMFAILYIMTVFLPKPGSGHGRPPAGMHARHLPPAPSLRYTALPCGAKPSRDLPRPLSRRLGGRAHPGARRAGATCLPGVRYSGLWLRPGALRGVRPRLPGRLLLQRPRRLPLVQHSTDGRDSGPSRRSRPTPAAGAPGQVLSLPKRLRYYVQHDR
jgi:hypothetical protein